MFREPLSRRNLLRKAALGTVGIAGASVLAGSIDIGTVFGVGATLAAGHQVLVRRNPKSAITGYIQDPAIGLTATESLSLDSTRLRSSHKVFVRRGQKPATGWIKDPIITLTATETLTIPALSGGPAPTPQPQPGDLRGFGRSTQISNAALVTVTSLAELRSNIGAGGRNIKVNVPVGTVWSLAGSSLQPASGTTCDFGNLTLMNASVFLAGVSDVMLTNLRTHAGDQFGNATDVDSLTINGNSKPVRRVYIRNSQMLWGPDTDTAILGDIQDVTFERCVFAEGLYNSAHTESPHSLGPNVASEDPNTPAQRISFIESMVSTNQSRNFRLIGVDFVELIGCTIYNHNEGPQGCPTKAMILGCTWKKGPNALANTFRFRAQDGGHGAFVSKANTVFEHGGQVIGFSDSGVDSKVRATSSLFVPTEPEPNAANAHSIVLSSAGAFPADKQLARIRNHVSNGTGVYVNGFGKAGSYTALL